MATLACTSMGVSKLKSSAWNHREKISLWWLVKLKKVIKGLKVGQSSPNRKLMRF
jgi:hypothetical protein